MQTRTDPGAPRSERPRPRPLAADLRVLLGRDPGALERTAPAVVLLVLGGAAYGASLGLWRSPLQAGYVAVKFPLLLVLTTLATGLAGGMLALLLGARLSLSQSIRLMLASYALLAVVLGSLAPVAMFVLANLPRQAAGGGGILPYHAYLVCHVLLISFAGVLANVRLLAALERFCDGRDRARRVLVAWLAVHMFVGCQLSWNLRPFFGTPGLEVTFLRADAFRGSFYESVLVILTSWLFR